MGRGGVHSEKLAGHVKKLYPNKSGSLDHFAFVRCYADNDVSPDSADKAQHLVGWGCKVRLIDLQVEG